MKNFEFNIGNKFLINDMIMIIKDYKKDFKYSSSTSPNKNYIVEFYSFDKNIINNKYIDFCLNLYFEEEKKYKYIINERVLICKNITKL